MRADRGPKLLKDEFAKYSDKTNQITETGLEKIGKELGIDIYSDVIFLFRCL